MVIVEIFLNMKIMLVGPFGSRQKAMKWVGELIEDNPGETAVIAVNDNIPQSVRVYMGDQEEEDGDGVFPAAMAELFQNQN